MTRQPIIIFFKEDILQAIRNEKKLIKQRAEIAKLKAEIEELKKDADGNAQLKKTIEQMRNDNREMQYRLYYLEHNDFCSDNFNI